MGGAGHQEGGAVPPAGNRRFLGPAGPAPTGSGALGAVGVETRAGCLARAGAALGTGST